MTRTPNSMPSGPGSRSHRASRVGFKVRLASRGGVFFDARCYQIGLLAGLVIAVLGMLHKVALDRVVIMSAACTVLAIVCAIPLFWQVEAGGRRWISPALTVSAGFALYYGLGNVPCSLWAYEKMYIRNPGSYDFYPEAAVLAAIGLFTFLKGYQKGVSARLPGPRGIVWQTADLEAFWWFFMLALVLLTYAIAAQWLHGVLATTLVEFIPTSFVLLAILGFAIRGRGDKGFLGPHPVLFVISIVLPTIFFIASNRRYYSLSMIVLVFVLGRFLGTRWRLKHYIIALLAAAAIYLVITAGLREAVPAESIKEGGPGQKDLIYNLESMPQAVDRLFSSPPEADKRTSDLLERDSAYRMAGLEELAGILAARAEDRGHYMWGRCLFIGFAKMIPRLVWPSKPYFGEYEGSEWGVESLIIEQFGLSATDQLTTVLPALYADGGVVLALAGLWIIGLVSGGLANRTLGADWMSPRSMILLAPFSFSFFIFFERDAVEWVIHPLRNLLIIWILVRLVDGAIGSAATPKVRILSGPGSKPFVPASPAGPAGNSGADEANT